MIGVSMRVTPKVNPYQLHSSLDYNSPMVFERIRDLKTAHAR